VPTGNSSKSLPYVKDVTENGTFFRHVSKYFYSDLLIDGDDDDRRQATRLLQDLVTRYPENRRFYLRLISLLVERGHFKQSLIVYQQFIETKDLYNRQSQDLSLARLWAARAHLGLHDVEKALRETESVANTPWQEEFPSWGKSWFLLVRAQISDLTDKRSAAVAYYEQIIRAEPSPPTKILALAEAGLKTPFSQ
jgi:tetratricopeptide (TPR) repeat protein